MVEGSGDFGEDVVREGGEVGGRGGKADGAGG